LGDSKVRFLYVFDLDGTLADTADLDRGRRTPHLLLQDDPLDTGIGVGPSRWGLRNERDVDMPAAPGQVIASGHRAAVITRAPKPYASTLAGLLELERLPIWPSTRVNVAEKLRQLANLHRIPLEQVVYVGDTNDDRAEARLAGCHFTHVDQFELPDKPDLRPPAAIDEDSVAGIVSSLHSHPQHRRDELQARLARLVTPAHRYCLALPRTTKGLPDGAFMEAGVEPTLFTRDERGETYLRMLRSLFPAHRTSRVRPSSGDSYYVCGYVKLEQEGSTEADPLGGLFRVMKNYRSTSGPEVELGSLPLVRDVLTSHLSEWFRGFGHIGGMLVDHVAPNGFSAQTPGRVSSRLARLVADEVSSMLGTEWQPVATVSRTREGLKPNTDYDGSPIWAVLIDDQRTTGGGLARHIDTSPLPEWEVTLTWSHSRPPTPTRPDPALRRTTADCYWPDPGPCPKHGSGALLQSSSSTSKPVVEPAKPGPIEVNAGAANVITTLQTYANAWAKWEPEDDATLARLVAEGRTTQDMARIMGRTPGAVSSRAKKMRDGLL